MGIHVVCVFVTLKKQHLFHDFRATACTEDWLEIYVLFRDGNDRFIGRFCGTTAPGPMESPRGATGLRIHLHTDAENVSSGFKGRYVFEVAKSVTGERPPPPHAMILD